MKKVLLNISMVEYISISLIISSAIWLIISVTNISISNRYQQSYLLHSQNVDHNLEEIYSFKYSDYKTYDDFSYELVNVETYSQLLYENVVDNHNRYPKFINPIENELIKLANDIRLESLLFAQRLDTILSAKVSLDFSTTVIDDLSRDALTKLDDNNKKLAVYDYISNKIDSNELIAIIDGEVKVQPIISYVSLRSRVEKIIGNEEIALVESGIHESINKMNNFLVECASKAFINIISSSGLLLIALIAYLYWRQWNHQYHENALNRELLEKERERSHLSLVVEYASDAILITDKDGFIQWANHAFETLSGYTVKEVEGNQFGGLLQGEETSQEELRRITTELKLGDVIKSELINYHKDGSPYWIEMVITPIKNNNNKIEQFIVVERDTSQRKQLEQNLEQAVMTADASNKAKSTFLATMSHELRTPLNGILGMAQILESSPVDKQQAEHISILIESGNHLLSLLNDILDISKIEEGMLELETADFTIEDICGPITSTYKVLCNEKGIEFKVNNQLPMGKPYRGDKSRIRQLIFNLLSNAVKFTSEGSVSICFTTDKKVKNGCESLLIVVEDTGIGISPERTEAIFDPFVQAESSTTRKFGGTGLGLAIVKKLTNLMQGDITIDSKKGVGTKFTITIFLKPGEIVEGKNTQAISLDKHALPNTLSILIVEDNNINALVAKTFCKKQGHNVDLAVNGQVAIDKVKERNYDLILMDNHMPIMDGIEATRIIKKELKDKVVIFGCTADVLKESHEKFIGAGASYVLTKPLQKESFVEALERNRDLLTSSDFVIEEGI
ncbi:ATP-binding protein [Photobacterium minamisatsumaniensis]|uniref:PAS domain-containing hybrid sensor histidine kinase/response regulator n=1 Tax=Photobacterium minamisatsumaniensis TaxID=2910233 RepID=UPI003D0C60CD